jgi:hypothetical protein
MFLFLADIHSTASSTIISDCPTETQQKFQLRRSALRRERLYFSITSSRGHMASARNARTKQSARNEKGYMERITAVGIDTMVAAGVLVLEVLLLTDHFDFRWQHTF